MAEPSASLPEPLPAAAESIAESSRIVFASNFSNFELTAGVVDHHRDHGGILDTVMLRYPGRMSPAVDVGGILAHVSVESLTEWILARNCPVVHLLNSPLPLPPWPHVVCDREAVGRLSAQHLIQLGDYNLAYYRYLGTPGYDQMRDGFVREAKAHGRTVHEIGPRWVLHEGAQISATMGPRLDWLIPQLRALPMPLAVMAEDDGYAIDLVFAARRLKLQIPEDLAILGSDDQSLVLGLIPEKISSIDVNFREIGRLGSELLHRMMLGAKPGSAEVPMLTKVPPKGVMGRSSTSTFNCDHPGVTSAATFVRRHAHEPINVSDVAAHAKMPLRTLQNEYPRHVGRTVKDDIQVERLKHVLRLLEKTDLKLAAVASESGFGSPEYLIRVFQAHYKMSPIAWRKEHQRP